MATQKAKPYTITWPFSEKTAEDIDQTFDILFKQVEINAPGAGVLPVVLGGTGLGSFVKGDLLYATTATTIAGLHDVATGNVVLSGGVNTAPAYGKVALSGSVTHVTGTLPVTNGGTGLSTVAQGDLLYGSAADTLSRLAKDANATRYLGNTGTSNNPAWAQVNLTNGVTGTLPATSGGTGHASYAVGDILYASTTTALSRLADVATGNALISGGVNTAPSWGKIGLTTHVSGTLAEGNGGTNQSTYAQGDILYASASNTLSKLAKDTNTSRYLANRGTNNNPVWSQVNLQHGIEGTLQATNGGTDQVAYAVGDLLYADTTTHLSKLADVATGNALISGGVSTAPSWGKIADAHISDVTESKITDGSILARLAANEVISGTWTFGAGAGNPVIQMDAGAGGNNDLDLRQQGTLAARIRANGGGGITIRTATYDFQNLAGAANLLQIGTTGALTIYGTSLPNTDNTYNLGDATHRWALVRGTVITPGDLTFENAFSITEHDHVGIDKPGLAFRAPSGALIAFLDEQGDFYAHGYRSLAELYEP